MQLTCESKTANWTRQEIFCWLTRHSSVPCSLAGRRRTWPGHLYPENTLDWIWWRVWRKLNHRYDKGVKHYSKAYPNIFLLLNFHFFFLFFFFLSSPLLSSPLLSSLLFSFLFCWPTEQSLQMYDIMECDFKITQHANKMRLVSLTDWKVWSADKGMDDMLPACPL